jgi:hypothetical protein
MCPRDAAPAAAPLGDALLNTALDGASDSAATTGDQRPQGELNRPPEWTISHAGRPRMGDCVRVGERERHIRPTAPRRRLQEKVDYPCDRNYGVTVPGLHSVTQ